MLLYECNKKTEQTKKGQKMENKNEIEQLTERRHQLETAYMLIKMGYSYKDRYRILSEGYTGIEIDQVTEDMYTIFYNALTCLNFELGRAIVLAYDPDNGRSTLECGKEIRNAREIAGKISRLMLNDGRSLYNDMKDTPDDMDLKYVVSYTLYESRGDCPDGIIESQLLEMLKEE